jgi:SHS family lactate transporter-like MFS transporter
LLGVGAFLGGALGVGYSGVTPVLTTSLFPAHVRARAIGIVYHAGALLAAFVPWAIGMIVETTGLSLATTIELFAGIGLVAMAAAVFALRGELVVTDSSTDASDSRPSMATRPSAPVIPVHDAAISKTYVRLNATQGDLDQTAERRSASA